MTITTDYTSLKVRQRTTWASGDYSKIGTIIHPMSERLAEAAGLTPGARVLDVATGSGNAAIAAARYNCVVTGLDYVPELLDRARTRIAAEGLAAEFITGDAEDLPFPDASFDAVLSCVGVMFAPDQEQAAAELVRVCRPGGTIGLVSWTPDGFLGALFRTVGGHVPPPAGVRPPVEWGSRERLRGLLGSAVSRLDLVELTFRFPFAAADFVEFMRVNYGPVRKAFEALDDTGRGRLREDLVALCRSHERDGGIAATYLQAVAVRA